MIDDIDEDDEDPREELLAGDRVVDPRGMPVRFHHLRAIGQSPAHAYHAFQSDDDSSIAKRFNVVSKAKGIGAGVHALLFGQPIATWSQRTKGGKLSPRSKTNGVWQAFCAEHRGASIMSEPERATADRVVAAIRANRDAASLLAARGLKVEQQIANWTQLGRARRSTPDMWTLDDVGLDGKPGGFVAELKTTRCAAPGVFWRDVKRYAYHAQLADQRAAIAATAGRAPRETYIVAVESSPPHVVQVYRLPWQLLEDGEQLCSIWLDRLLVVEAAGQWSTGYAPGVVDLEFPDFGAPPAE